MSEFTGALWAADAHQFGPGKVHIVEENDVRTLCGKWLKAIPGKLTRSGRATCKICLNAVENRAHREVQRVEWEKQSEERRLEREAQSREWWAKYNAYLKSPQWQNKRLKVLQRAGNMCECCLDRRATQVHHTTYEHLGCEPLWELRAICKECHDFLTEEDRARRSA